MNHLHDLQEVIFVQLLKPIGKLVHVNLERVSVLQRQPQTHLIEPTHILICALLLLGALLATSRALVLDTILITGDRTGLAQRSHQSRLGVLEGLHHKTHR